MNYELWNDMFWQIWTPKYLWKNYNSDCFHLHNLLFTRTCSSINRTHSVGKGNDDYDGNDNDNYNVNDNNNVNDGMSSFDDDDQNRSGASDIRARESEW